MSKTELAVYKKSLEQLEDEIRTLDGIITGNWFEIGHRLDEIKKGKYEQAGCKDWKEYCDSGRLSLVGTKRIAEMYLQVFNRKQGILKAQTVLDRPAFHYSLAYEFSKLPSSRKVEQVARRLAKYLKSDDGKKENLSKSLIRKFVNADLKGEPKSALSSTPDLTGVIQDELHRMDKLYYSYTEKIPEDEWRHVPKKLLQELAKELRALADFLES